MPCRTLWLVTEADEPQGFLSRMKQVHSASMIYNGKLIIDTVWLIIWNSTSNIPPLQTN